MWKSTHSWAIGASFLIPSHPKTGRSLNTIPPHPASPHLEGGEKKCETLIRTKSNGGFISQPRALSGSRGTLLTTPTRVLGSRYSGWNQPQSVTRILQLTVVIIKREKRAGQREKEGSRAGDRFFRSGWQWWDLKVWVSERKVGRKTEASPQFIF